MKLLAVMAIMLSSMYYVYGMYDLARDRLNKIETRHERYNRLSK